MTYNIRVHNYDNGRIGRSERTPLTVSERTPLTVGSAASTDGTFSTITLDSTIAGNSRTANNNGDGDSSNNNWSRRASRCHLLVFLLIYLAIVLWAANNSIWWAASWSALLVCTGTNSLVADDRSEGTHRCTLCVWFLSAACSIFLFAFYFCRDGDGEDHILWWCLVHEREKDDLEDYSTIPISVPFPVCTSLSIDGTLEKIRIGIIVAGIVLGLPFLGFSLRMVQLFYLDAVELNRILPR